MRLLRRFAAWASVSAAQQQPESILTRYLVANRRQAHCSVSRPRADDIERVEDHDRARYAPVIPPETIATNLDVPMSHGGGRITLRCPATWDRDLAAEKSPPIRSLIFRAEANQEAVQAGERHGVVLVFAYPSLSGADIQATEIIDSFAADGIKATCMIDHSDFGKHHVHAIETAHSDDEGQRWVHHRIVAPLSGARIGEGRSLLLYAAIEAPTLSEAASVIGPVLTSVFWASAEFGSLRARTA